MMHFRNLKMLSLSVLAALGLTAQTAFAAEQYECTFTERSNRSPVPETMSIRLNSQGTGATIQDVFTRQISSDPFPARVSPINPSKIDIKWQLVGLSYQGTETKITGGIVDYKVTLNKVNKTVKLYGVSREYFSRIYGQGKCVRTQ